MKVIDIEIYQWRLW